MQTQLLERSRSRAHVATLRLVLFCWESMTDGSVQLTSYREATTDFQSSRHVCFAFRADPRTRQGERLCVEGLDLGVNRQHCPVGQGVDLRRVGLLHFRGEVRIVRRGVVRSEDLSGTKIGPRKTPVTGGSQNCTIHTYESNQPPGSYRNRSRSCSFDFCKGIRKSAFSFRYLLLIYSGQKND